MLFNSYVFIFCFLPVVLLGFHGLSRRGVMASSLWLVTASLFFYGWWNPAYLALIVASVLFNYCVGLCLLAQPAPGRRKLMLVGGLVGNLAVLGYFKYATFLVANLNAVSGSTHTLGAIILPLGISFFTFQQVAYLVDTYRGQAGERNLLFYALFVTFFPQLIAGPIVHHREMLPQFRTARRVRAENLAVGLSIFLIGLFKKVVLADGISKYATPVFADAELGNMLTLFEAWSGAGAYTLQLYFDFSGYSDMAIGLGRMFGITLPLNFHSPYKACSIIDFWRRWHMTLSRFLRDYLYIPLGGSRRGQTRHVASLMTTMLLGGLWHGAGWTFVFWGGLHGVYLVLNHTWRLVKAKAGLQRAQPHWTARIGARLTTFVAVVIGWVFFRASSFAAAIHMLKAMFGCNGAPLPMTYHKELNKVFGFADLLQRLGMEFRPLAHFGRKEHFLSMVGLLLIVFCLPNTQQLMSRYQPVLERYADSDERTPWPCVQWRPSIGWALYIGAIGAASVFCLGRIAEFLYYQF